MISNRSIALCCLLAASCASPHTQKPAPPATAAVSRVDIPTDPVCGAIPAGSFAIATRPGSSMSLPILEVEMVGAGDLRFSGFDARSSIVGSLDSEGRIEWTARLSGRTKPVNQWFEGGSVRGFGDELDGAGLIHIGPRGQLGWKTSFPLGTVAVDTGSIGRDESLVLAWRPAKSRMDAYLARVDKSGETKWLNRLFHDELTIWPMDMEPTPAGFVITGTATRFVRGSDGYDHDTNEYTMAVHVNRNGEVEWAKGIELETGGGNQDTQAVSMPAIDRIYILAGGAPGVLVELDTRGNLISARTLGAGRAIVAAGAWDSHTLALSIEGPERAAILALYRDGAVINSRQLMDDGEDRRFGRLDRKGGRWVVSAAARMTKIQNVVVLSGTSALENGPCLESAPELVSTDIKAKASDLELKVDANAAPTPRTDL